VQAEVLFQDVCFFGYSPLHKGYKSLDRTTGRIYISRDVIFDESVFPFATPGAVIDISQLQTVSFPANEPAIQGPNLHVYDISLLPVDPPMVSHVFPVQEHASTSTAPDASEQLSVIDVHGHTVHASPSVPWSPERPHSPGPMPCS
jgi:hypothetical protein